MTPIEYEDKIQRLERDLELRRQQLFEYMGVEERREEAVKVVHSLEKQIEVSNKENQGHKLLISKKDVEIDGLKKELSEYQKAISEERQKVRNLQYKIENWSMPVLEEKAELEEKIDSLRDEVDDLNSEIHSLQEKLGDEIDYNDVVRTRIWEILNDQVSGVWPIYADEFCSFNGVPKTWEDTLKMLREYVWDEKTRVAASLVKVRDTGDQTTLERVR